MDFRPRIAPAGVPALACAQQVRVAA